MPGLAVREVECVVCRKRFSLLTADLIVPWTLICDECLVEIWELEGDALTDYLASPPQAETRPEPEGSTAPPAEPHPYESQIIAHLQGLKQRWATAQEAIRASKNPFLAP